MVPQLHITIIQTHLHWENPIANRNHFTEKLKKIKKETDLIILPEMFTTGFSMNASQLAEKQDGATLKWMKEAAKTHQAAIVGSMIIEEDTKYYNRLFFVQPDGTVNSYDKKHTFTLAGEHKVYTAGTEVPLIIYKGWKIRPLVCYDLRFPVWARNTDAYDILLYVANWPNKRVAAWDALLKARAIENMAYCIGVNRIGEDGNGHLYTGHSAVYNVLGEHITTKQYEDAFIETVTLSKEHIATNRDYLQFLNDADRFTLN